MKHKTNGTAITAHFIRKATTYFLASGCFLVFIFSLSLGRPATSVQAAVGINKQINFQGKVVNANGTNVTDGSYSFSFNIYNLASGGVSVWSETKSLTVASGVFQTNLGDTTTLPGSLDFNSDSLYLGIQFNNDIAGEMSPRVRFTSVPQAFNSEKLGGLLPAAFGQLSVNQTWTGTNIFQPNTNISGLLVKQTSIVSPTADIFNIQTANGSNIFQVTGPVANEAVVTIQSVGATRGLTLQSGSGTISLGTTTSVTANGALTVASGGATALNLAGGAASTWSIGITNALTLTSSSVQVTSLGVLSISGAQAIDLTTITAGNSLTVQPSLLTNATGTGGALTLRGGDESGTTAAIGGNLSLTAGSATGASGARTGGDVIINGGTGATNNGNITLGSATTKAITLGNGTDNTSLTLQGNGLSTLGGSLALARNGSGTGDSTLRVSGAPVADATSSLLRIGSAITGGNAVASGGTYIGLNAPTSGAGSVADFINLQLNGVSKFKVDNAGVISSAGAAGITRSGGTACGASQALNAITVVGGIVTGGNCANNLTDIAEQYDSIQKLEPGDVVAVDHSHYPNVLKSTQTGQADLIGIVSTAPYRTLGDANPGYPIALIGRVPTKVNLEGGVIQPGDKLTSSSIAGYARKASAAGPILGMALQTYDGTQTGNKIEVFVNLGYFDPVAGQNLQGGEPSFANLNVGGLTTTHDLMVNGTASFQGNITVNGHIIGNADTRGEVIISVGQTNIRHEYRQVYDSKPVVVASPIGRDNFVQYSLEGDSTGFTLYLSAPASRDTTFSYLVQQ